MRLRASQPVAIMFYQQIRFEIDTAPSSGSSKAKITKNGRTILCDVLYAEELRLESDYNDVELFFRSIYKLKMTVGTMQTIMYSIVYLIDTEAAPNLTNSFFIKP